LGIVVFVALVYLFVRFVKYNLFVKEDKIWADNIQSVLAGDHSKKLRIGKYNAGQKFLFWGTMALICVLLVSGLMIWRAYFAHLFPIPALRLALLVHSLAGISLILLIIGHIYLALWVKGSIRGMVTGYVSHAWARTHHDRWHAEISSPPTAPAKAKGGRTR
jgi:formate dehydrogenase subunit gamma